MKKLWICSLAFVLMLPWLISSPSMLNQGTDGSIMDSNATPNPGFSLFHVPEAEAAQEQSKTEPKGNVTLIRYSMGDEVLDSMLYILTTEDPHMTSEHSYLVRTDAKGKFVPDLAESWKLVGQKDWEFKLKSGAKFHNGEPITAESFVIACQRYFGAKNKNSLALELAKYVDKVEAKDEYTLIFHMKEAYFLPARALLAPIPPKYYAQTGDEGFAENPIGSGPFKLKKRVRGQSMEFEAFEGFHDPSRVPSVKTMVHKLVPEASTRMAMLKTGEADIMDLVMGAMAQELKSDPQLRIVRANDTFSYHIGFGHFWHEGVRTADPRVRQALSLAINREAIVKGLYFGEARAEKNPVSFPFSPGWDDSLPALAYNPDKAKQLLTEAGFPQGFEVEFWHLTEHSSLWEACRSYWEKIGIKTKMRQAEKGAFYAAFRAHKIPDIHSFGITGPTAYDPMFGLNVYYHSKAVYSSYANPEYDKLVEQGLKTLDMKERSEIAKKASRILYDDMARIPLITVPALFAVGPRIKDYTPQQGNPMLVNLETITVK